MVVQGSPSAHNRWYMLWNVLREPTMKTTSRTNSSTPSRKWKIVASVGRRVWRDRGIVHHSPSLLQLPPHPSLAHPPTPFFTYTPYIPPLTIVNLPSHPSLS